MRRFKEAGILIAFLLFLFAFSNRSFSKINERPETSRTDLHLKFKTSTLISSVRYVSLSPANYSPFLPALHPECFKNELHSYNNNIFLQLKRALTKSSPSFSHAGKFQVQVYPKEDEDITA